MRAQTTVILIIAFLLSHLVGLLIYARDRHAALAIAETYDITERAAGVSVLLRNLPTGWRTDVVQATDSRTFRTWISADPPLAQGGESDAEIDLLNYLRSLLPRLSDRDIRLRIAPRVPDGIDPPERPPAPAATGGAASMSDSPRTPVVVISVNHPDGAWLNFIGFTAEPASFLPAVLGGNLLLASFAVALVAFWLVHRVTAPLSRLSVAAERLGKNIRTEPLSEDGPAEVAQAARAFNLMQSRLTRLVENRTELLAAISHDLRTPITQMRLRTELAANSTLRRKNLEALDEMEAIILTFMDFARAAHDREERLQIDLGALVESICADRSDAGADVECEGEDKLLVECKRLALKRAISNLVDNALKYGKSARVGASRSGGEIRVRIDDTGPGIPDAELEAVFMPFYRSDPSRNKKTGGVGLGLSIAQAIAQDHGGEIRLSNRAGGGLRAELRLPI